MSTEYSKTLLRKGALKSHGSHSIPRHATQRKGATSNEEEALLLASAKIGARPPHGAKMRSE